MLLLLAWISLLCGAVLLIIGYVCSFRRSDEKFAPFCIISSVLIATSMVSNFLSSHDLVGKLLSILILLVSVGAGCYWFLVWRYYLKAKGTTVPIPKEWEDPDIDGPHVIGRWPKDPPRE
jgi:hypothetical protein